MTNGRRRGESPEREIIACEWFDLWGDWVQLVRDFGTLLFFVRLSRTLLHLFESLLRTLDSQKQNRLIFWSFRLTVPHTQSHTESHKIILTITHTRTHSQVKHNPTAESRSLFISPHHTCVCGLTPFGKPLRSHPAADAMIPAMKRWTREVLKSTPFPPRRNSLIATWGQRTLFRSKKIFKAKSWTFENITKNNFTIDWINRSKKNSLTPRTFVQCEKSEAYIVAIQYHTLNAARTESMNRINVIRLGH